MKTKRIAFYALGTALMLSAASCSDDIATDQKEVYTGPTQTNFLKLNIVSGSEARNLPGTRYEDANDTNDEGNKAQYEDGITAENAVNKLRIYFFDEKGDAANVVLNDEDVLVSYLDITNPEGTATPGDDNIEKKLNPMLIINTKEGDELPASIVAVLNPPTKVENGETKDVIGEVTSITDLNTKTGNFVGNTSQGFLMSNSIYAENGKVMEAVPVQEYMYNDQAEAEEHPVTVYVERVNAKARVTTTLPATEVGDDILYDTKEEYAYASQDPDWEGADGKIYVKFLGWNVTCTTNESNLMKEINPTWTNEGVFGSTTAFDWNSPTRFRSFWAINPALSYTPGVLDSEGKITGNYMYGDFENAQAIKDFAATGTNYTYLQENAALSATEACAHPTQLIVAARLCNSKGDILTLAEYGGQQFTLEGLKIQMAALAKNVYVQTGEGSYKQITAENIQFITATELAQQGNPDIALNDVPNRYTVYANLVEKDAQGNTYVYAMPNDETNVITPIQGTAAANTWLVGHVKHAKIWEGGNTYYYIDIKHLGRTGSLGAVGIVRNHIYDLNINTLKGLGTPVYDPNEIIYPETPDDDYTFIGAQINILNWRLVPQNVSFVW